MLSPNLERCSERGGHSPCVSRALRVGWVVESVRSPPMRKQAIDHEPAGWSERTMEIRFYHDPDTGLPHIYGHGVTEDEVRQVLRSRGEDLPGTRGSRMKLGQTAAGRYL